MIVSTFTLSLSLSLSLSLLADDVLLVDNASIRSVNSGLNSISNSTIPSIKFHLNLILESSRNANSSLVQCLTVVSHQNEVSLIFVEI